MKNLKKLMSITFLALFLSITAWASSWDSNANKNTSSINFEALCKAEREAGEIPSSPCCYKDNYRCTGVGTDSSTAGLVWIRKHKGLEELVLEALDEKNENKRAEQLKKQQEQIKRYQEKSIKWAQYDKSILSDQIKDSLFIGQLVEPGKSEFSCFKRGSPEGGFFDMKEFQLFESTVFSAAIGVRGLSNSNGGIVPFFIMRENQAGTLSREIVRFGDVNKNGASPAYTPCAGNPLTELNLVRVRGINSIRNIDFVSSQSSKVLTHLALVDTTDGQMATITKEGNADVLPAVISGLPMEFLVNQSMQSIHDIYALVDYGISGFAILYGNGKSSIFQQGTGAGTLRNRKADINQELARATGTTIDLQNPTGWR